MARDSDTAQQYRLHRSPSTQLVMDLMQVQDELNIIVKLMNQQLQLSEELQQMLGLTKADQQIQFTSLHLQDSLASLGDNLQRELADVLDLLENTNNLVNRTVQLVNIRLEDHGKAILVFTIVTIIFLPLNFVSSFFGMNVSDIRNLDQNQSLFWLVAVCVTAGVLGLSIFFAFSGSMITDRILQWKENRQRVDPTASDATRSFQSGRRGFNVMGVKRV